MREIILTPHPVFIMIVSSVQVQANLAIGKNVDFMNRAYVI